MKTFNLSSFVVKPEQVYLWEIPPFDGEFNPHNKRWFIIVGLYGVDAVVAADHAQDALDVAIDNDLMSQHAIDGDAYNAAMQAIKATHTDAQGIVDESTMHDAMQAYDEKNSVTALGNAGEPFDLTDCHIVECTWADFPLEVALEVAQRNGQGENFGC